MKRKTGLTDHPGLMTMLIILGAVAIAMYAQWAHSFHCTGPTAGQCSWFWCPYFK